MNSYRRRYAVLLTLSLLIHLAILLWLLDHFNEQKPTPRQQTVSISLAPPPPVPPDSPAVKQEIPEQEEKSPDKPEPEEAPEKESNEKDETQPDPEHHAPMDNADQFASDNQDDPSKTEIVAGGGTRSPAEKEVSQQIDQDTEVIEPQQSQELAEELSPDLEQETPVDTPKADKQNKERRVIDTEDVARALWENRARDRTREEMQAITDQPGATEQALIDLITGKANFTEEQKNFELALPADESDNFGNAKLLTEDELRDTVVEQPFSEQKAKELELANIYLRRMSKQVESFWVNPYEGNRLYKGIIVMELDLSGHLVRSDIYRSSGNRLLDISVLDAIRAVPRYEVPDNKVIVDRYYRYLHFHYSSIEEKTELMPFEKEAENEKAEP